MLCYILIFHSIFYNLIFFFFLLSFFKMNKIPLAGERPERKVEIEQKKDPYDLKDKREEFRASSQHKQIE